MRHASRHPTPAEEPMRPAARPAPLPEFEDAATLSFALERPESSAEMLDAVFQYGATLLDPKCRSARHASTRDQEYVESVVREFAEFLSDSQDSRSTVDTRGSRPGADRPSTHSKTGTYRARRARQREPADARKRPTRSSSPEWH